MILRSRLQKNVKFELKIYNIHQNLAKLMPNYISGPELAHFFIKKAIFKGGPTDPPPPHLVYKRQKNLSVLIGLSSVLQGSDILT